MLTYKIHLIRTGSSLGGSDFKYTGCMDNPLSKTGTEHINAMKEHFEYPRVEVVYSSPLKRCLETADILYPDNQVLTLEELAALCLGEFEGKTYNQLEDDPDFANWLRNSEENTPPGGEDMNTFTTRIVTALDKIFSEMMQQGLHNVAVITHSGVIMTLLAAVGQPKLPLNEWAVDNGIGFTLLMTPQMWMRDYSAEVYSRIPLLKDDSGNLD